MVDLSLLQDFITEAEEHLEEMESSLLQLETDPDNRDILNDIFRSMHTIKGAAQFVGLEKISELSHKLENLLDLLRKEGEQLDQDIIDTLINAKDRISVLVVDLQRSNSEEAEILDLVERIDKLSAGLFEVEIKMDEVEEVEEEEPKEEKSFDVMTVKELKEIVKKIPGIKGVHSMTKKELLAALVDETYEEEYDQELFGIFLKQLKENISFLQAQLGQLDTSPDKTEVLNRCADSIKNLQSSANYMDYPKIIQLYKAWSDEIDKAKKELSAGNEVSFDFMNAYIDRIVKIFPQAEEIVLEVEEAAADEVEEAIVDEDQEDVLTPIDEMEALTEDSDLVLDEVIDLSPDVPDHKIETDILEDETYEEEYDQELFGIFIKQLKEIISFLRLQIDELDTSPDKTEVVNRCADSIKSLQSSANYMGYEKLVLLYHNWCAEIDKAKEELSAGNEVSFDFMNAYVDNIVKIFPQAEEIKAEVEEIAMDEDQEDVLTPIDELEPALEAPGMITEDEELFDRLSDALDSSMEQAPDAETEPLHGVIEEMLYPEDEKIEAVSVETEDARIPRDEPPARDLPIPDTAVAEPEKREEEEEEIPEHLVDRRKIDQRIVDRRKSEDPGERIFKQSVRVDAEKIDFLMNQVGELVVSRAFFAQLFNEMRNLEQGLKESAGLDQKGLKPVRELTFRLGEATVALGRVSNELQEGVMKVRMLPIAQLFNRYPRLVRDLVHKTDKQVNLKIKGEETELDKMVIEEISDPLIHIIRNAVDHGIETVKERKRKGKPESGTVVLEAYHESNHIVIEVIDDGRGIDPDRIKSKAMEQGLFFKEELDRMSDGELMRVIMAPGFSTSERATRTSGRGVGMDVVKKNVEKLNGTIEIDSKPGVRTQIRIKIPLTLAIIPALMVRVRTELFTIPLSAVEETLRIYEHESTTIEGVEVIHLRDTTMPIFRLSDIFNITSDTKDSASAQSFVVIVSTGLQRIGLVVDELMGQEEVVIKPLEDYLRENSGFSGATIIGDGRISLILDIYELVNMTSSEQVKMHQEQELKRKAALGIDVEQQAPATTH